MVRLSHGLALAQRRDPRTTVRESVGNRRFRSSRFRGSGRTGRKPATWRSIAEAARSGGVVTTSDTPYMRVFRARDRGRRCGAVSSRAGAAASTWSARSPTTSLRRAPRSTAMPYGTLGFDVAAQLAQLGPIAVPPLDVIVPPDRQASRRASAIRRIELGDAATSRARGPAGHHALPSPSSTSPARSRRAPATSAPSRRPSPSASRTTAASSRPSTATAAAAARHGCRRMLELGVDDLRVQGGARAPALDPRSLPTQPGVQRPARPVEGRRALAGAPPRRRDQRLRRPRLTRGRTTATTARSSTCSLEGLADAGASRRCRRSTSPRS